MNIDMINNQGVNHGLDIESTKYGTPSSADSRMRTQGMGYSLDITGTVMENAAYGKEELRSANEVALSAGAQDVALQRDYAAVMSNSMSAEDYAKLTEDGINPTQTTVEESVTNLDKIKVTLAEAGITIEGYNDDLSQEDLKSVVGNAAIAQSIRKALNRADLPDTKENIEAMTEALSTAVNLQPLSDESYKYMIENDMEPTIENIYKAEYSSGIQMSSAKSSFNYAGGIAYASGDLSKNAWSDLENQALEIVREADIPNEIEGLEDAKWLVEHQVPLTRDTLSRYEELKEVSLPVKPEEVIEAMTVAIEEGKEPKEANLNETESIYRKAVRLVKEFAEKSDGGDLTKHRQLEEVRLAMTTEANLTLLRKGIEIETKPLSELVELLKEAEREYYRPLLTDQNDDSTIIAADTRILDQPKVATDAVNTDRRENFVSDLELDEKIALYKSTQNIVEKIPAIPVETVALLSSKGSENNTESNDFTLQNLYDNGIVRKDTYDRANESYEALMTAPRADMGDSIRKAFANVDDILKDLNLDINEANRKAIRTLGYAGMDITKESAQQVRDANMAVERVVTMLNPKTVLKMIREGHNPINESIYELDKNLSQESVEESSEKYSRFLFNLERSGEITDSEKTAYIGMFRLFHQIEKSDGKLVGNVLSTGEELTLANMLSALKSNKRKNMDIKIDDDFGALEELVSKGEGILEQIEKGFADLLSRPVDRDYANEKLQEIRKAAKEEGAAGILEQINEPVTIENILAVSDMVTGGNKAVRRLFSNTDDREDRTEKAAKVEVASEHSRDYLSAEDATELAEDFNSEAEAASAYEKYIEKALNISEKRIENADKYIDVKEWAMIHKQLGFARSLSQKEAYDIPVLTEDGYTSVHLTIEHNSENKGRVSARIDSERYGKVDAKFRLLESGVDGFIVSDSRAGTQALKGIEESFNQSLKENGIENTNLTFVYSPSSQAADFAPNNDTGVANSDLYKIAKAFIVAIGNR